MVYRSSRSDKPIHTHGLQVISVTQAHSYTWSTGHLAQTSPFIHMVYRSSRSDKPIHTYVLQAFCSDKPIHTHGLQVISFTQAHSYTWPAGHLAQTSPFIHMVYSHVAQTSPFIHMVYRSTRSDKPIHIHGLQVIFKSFYH